MNAVVTGLVEIEAAIKKLECRIEKHPPFSEKRRQLQTALSHLRDAQHIIEREGDDE